ncbi:MAG: radical SAM family heme chaperone HemW [Knoellia sp.]
MPRLPDGDPAPDSGELPATALATLGKRPFGIYLHVPFCRVRCGYCDFNTYTLTELGPGASTSTFIDTTLAELDLARAVLGGAAPAVDTIFVGGGTPTMLAAADLVKAVDGIRQRFGLSDDIEVTTEANPDSVTPDSLSELADGGFTRISLGMQSAVPHVLATLDRTHDPAGVEKAVRAAQDAGMVTSVDLIYGTPGESVDDWRRSLDQAISLESEHVSAYALVVEEGTKLAAQVRRGEVARPDDDDEATKYEIADEVLSAAGFDWYEVSNWTRTPAGRCRHNDGYWTGGNWWGVGPGAHSHVGGVRWWNVKHPRAYAGRLADALSPGAGRETLTAEQLRDEQVLLQVRVRDGLVVDELDEVGRRAVAGLVADGLVDGTAAVRDRRVVLTLRGRLLADTVVRRLLGVDA